MSIGKISLFGLCGAALVTVGVWLGRSTLPEPPRASIAMVPSPATKHVAPVYRANPDVHQPVPGLAIDLRDPDPKVRRAAIAEADDPQALLAASRDADLDVALAATEGLGAMYRDGRITAHDLAARITDHALPEKVRVTAMNALGLVSSPDAAALLADLVAHGDAIDRRSAAILLAHQDAATAVPALIGALSDRDALVQANAHDSLRAFARGRDYGLDTASWTRWWSTRSAAL